MRIDTDGREQLHLIARRERCQVILESLHVHRRVSRHVAAASGWEKKIARRRVNRRKRDWRNRILKAQRKSGLSSQQRLKDEWKCTGNVILQPKIGKQR